MRKRPHNPIQHLPPPGYPNPILAKLVLDSFTFKPTTIPICTMSETVQFDWKITGVEDVGITFTLQVGTEEISVPAAGGRPVVISSPTTYMLFAYLPSAGVSRILTLGAIIGSPSPNAVNITINNSQLSDAANPTLEAAIASTVGDKARLAGIEWDITSDGIYLAVNFYVGPTKVPLYLVLTGVTIVPFVNPQGELTAAASDFFVNFNPPSLWYLLSPTYVVLWDFVSLIVLIYQSQVGPLVEQAITNLVQQLGQSVLSTGYRIAQVQLYQGFMVVTVCPTT